MAIAIYPTPVSSSGYKVAATLTDAYRIYKVSVNLNAGVYSFSWAGGGTLTVDFFSGDTLLSTSAATSPLAVNLASAATSYTIWNTAAGSIVTIELTSTAVAPVSGTMTTYTSSGTLTDTGYAYYTLVGGGGAGGSNNKTGGSSGGVFGGRVLLTGSMAYTIGAGAPRTTTNGASGATGGNSVFNGVTAGGGPGGINGASRTPATTNGGQGGAYFGRAGTESASAASFVSAFGLIGGNSTTGGGGAGTNQNGGQGPGAGSGIGTGGAGSRTDAADGSGYGAGGGGGGQYGGHQGGAGSPGVLYIIK
jgi:hypothetical protein